MTFSAAIRTGLRKGFTFSGRASRPEFWWFAPLGLAVPTAVVAALAPFLTIKPQIVIAALVWAVLALPFWSAASRRLHDAGRSGWWMIALALPAIYSIAMTANIATFNQAPEFHSWVLGLFYATFYFTAFPVLLAGTLIGMGLLLLVCLIPSEAGRNRWGPQRGATR